MEGFDVVAIAMPLYGRTAPRPASHDHGDLVRFNTTTFHGASVLLDPGIAALNYLRENTGRDWAHMTGYSGGGWATTYLAAVEPRIHRSYPVAGSLPLSLRGLGDLGDWEQWAPELYPGADYRDLYVMGASGKERGQVQMLNQYDPCCFAGDGRYREYEPAAAQRVAAIGPGSFRVWVDAGQRQHGISDATIDEILRDLGVGRRGR